jgi:hypothetical protein
MQRIPGRSYARFSDQAATHLVHSVCSMSDCVPVGIGFISGQDSGRQSAA